MRARCPPSRTSSPSSRSSTSRRTSSRRRAAAAKPPLRLPSEFPLDVEAFACDLDRTLIAEDAVLRPATRAALARARATGIHVVIATGRMFRAVKPYLDEAGLDGPVVCYQGAAVVEPATGRFVRHVPIPLDVAREAAAAVAAEGYHLNCYVDDELYVSEMTPEAHFYADWQGIEIHPVGDLVAWLDRPPTKLVSVGDPHELDALGARLKARFDSRLYVSKSLPEFLELASPEVTKAAGAAFVAERLGFAPERTVAFGDGENDVELLEWAGYAVAVENSHERVLAVADLVCPRPEAEGVALVIEAYLERR